MMERLICECDNALGYMDKILIVMLEPWHVESLWLMSSLCQEWMFVLESTMRLLAFCRILPLSLV